MDRIYRILSILLLTVVILFTGYIAVHLFFTGEIPVKYTVQYGENNTE